MTTQAQAFVAETDEDTAIALGNAARWVATLDDSAEATFPDGSVASCLEGGPWLAMTLEEQGEQDDRPRHERLGVDDALIYGED